jgi:hypothetical protein
MKLKKFNEMNETDDNSIVEKITEYIKEEYPKDWWDNEFYNNLSNYISEDDIIGDGDEENPEYESDEDAYINLCTGGAIEYDILDMIYKDICEKFDLINSDYFDKYKINNIVTDFMVNNIEWYDRLIFHESGYVSPEETYRKNLSSNWDLEGNVDGFKI